METAIAGMIFVVVAVAYLFAFEMTRASTRSDEQIAAALLAEIERRAREARR